MKPTPMIGHTFGRASVLGRAGHTSGKTKHLTYKCLCACGTQFVAPGNELRRGRVQSCGCLRRERSAERCKDAATRPPSRATHGATRGNSRPPEYRSWYHIKDRCGNPRNKHYADYGGRGIYVCDEWKNSFEAFLADMGRRPGPGYSIEREKNDGPYCKSNCKWATGTEQANNRRNNRVVEFNGESKTIAQWARHVGIGYSTLNNRIRVGWTVEEALSTPPLRR